MWGKLKKDWDKIKGKFADFNARVKNNAKEWWADTKKYWSEKVGKVKDDAQKSMYLKITAGNETTYAEITECMSWKRDIIDSNGRWINTDWYLKVFLDVPEDFMKRHLDDYVSIDYPDSGVEFFMSVSGSYSGWLRCYL